MPMVDVTFPVNTIALYRKKAGERTLTLTLTNRNLLCLGIWTSRTTVHAKPRPPRIFVAIHVAERACETLMNECGL